jgi:hypothetical protein
VADAESKRLYLALGVWAGLFVLGLALALAGVLAVPLESMLVSFVLGVAAIFVFFRPSKT